MKPRGGYAVMAQKHDRNDFLEDYPTPPWATRALVEHVLGGMRSVRRELCWEPACNRGYMAKPLLEYFGEVLCSDIHDYGWKGQETVSDFLFTQPDRNVTQIPDWIITNPPFRLAAQFALHALKNWWPASLALLVRTNFLEGKERYETLFVPHPPTVVAQFVERVPMVKGRHDPEASTATSYAWVVWSAPTTSAPTRTRFMWIPPCRRQLQRTTDA